MIEKIEEHFLKKMEIEDGLPSVSVLFFAQQSEISNQSTAEDLLSQTAADHLDLIVFLPDLFPDEGQPWLDSVCQRFSTVVVHQSGQTPRSALYNYARTVIRDTTYVTAIDGGDRIGAKYIKTLLSAAKKGKASCAVDPLYRLISCTRVFDNKKIDPYSAKGHSGGHVVDFSVRYDRIPWRLNGTLADATDFKTFSFREDLRYSCDRDFLFRQAVKYGEMKCTGKVSYGFSAPVEFDTINFPGYYEKDWYVRELDEFWLPLLEEMKQEDGQPPIFLQHAAFTALQLRLIANLNDNNKHVIPEVCAEDYIQSWRGILLHISDSVILNAYQQGPHMINACQMRFFLRVKYDDPALQFTISHMDRTPYFGKERLLCGSLLTQKVTIVSIERKGDTIHVEGFLPDLYRTGAGTFSVNCDGTPIPVQLAEEGGAVTLFGTEIYRQYPFHFSYRPEDVKRQRISLTFTDAVGSWSIPLHFETDQAKLSHNVKMSYWCFAVLGTQFMMTYTKRALQISRVGFRAPKKRERKLRRELRTGSPEAQRARRTRAAYFLFKSFLTRKPVWLFCDDPEIPGNPAEQFARYAGGKSDGIKKYCLIPDGGTPALRDSGIKPLKMGSLLHRLIFLCADLLITSGRNGFEVNGLTPQHSVYFRDLAAFRQVCVGGGEGAAAYEELLNLSQEVREHKQEDRFRGFFQTIRHTMLEGNIFYPRLEKLLHLKPKQGLGRILNRIDRHIALHVRKSYFKDEPIRNNRIFMITYDSQFICNPKYIAEEIIRRGDDLEIFWAIPKNGVIARESFPPEIRLVRRNSEAMLRAMASSRVWVENAIDVPLHGIPKRKGQVFINTWHGSLGIKRLSGDNVWIKRAYKTGKITDYCMTNSAFEEDVFRTTFWPDTPFLKYGHARNDLFFHANVMAAKRRRVLDTYNLPEDRKLFLYAPTFREEGMTAYENVDMDRLYQALTERFGGEWTILVRWHHKERGRKLSSAKSSHVMDASNFGDMQELLPAIDIGMSDYSSWVFDFILTGRPIFLYAPDVQDYDQARGFYYSIESTPFPIAHSNLELKQRVLDFDAGKYAADVKAFLDGKGCYEDGHAAERIVDFIEQLTQDC